MKWTQSFLVGCVWAVAVSGCAYDLAPGESVENTTWYAPDATGGQAVVEYSVDRPDSGVGSNLPSPAHPVDPWHYEVDLLDDSAPRLDHVDWTAPDPEPDGLLALYQFDDAVDGVIPNQAGGLGADLKIALGDLVPLPVGAAVREEVILRCDDVTSWIEQIVASDAFTAEVWVRPENVTQEGPARILGIEADPYMRNLMIAQKRDALAIRVLLDEDPSTETHYIGGVFDGGLVHLVVTYEEHAGLVVYVNAQPVLTQELAGATLEHWDRKYPLTVANLHQGDRTWLGELYHVALYHRALDPEEVAGHFTAGLVDRSSD